MRREWTVSQDLYTNHMSIVEMTQEDARDIMETTAANHRVTRMKHKEEPLTVRALGHLVARHLTEKANFRQR